MGQFDLLRRIVEVFERLGVRYYVTGSVASTLWGEPRFTNDIDVIAELGLEHVGQLCMAFPPPDFYVSEEAVRDAVVTRFQFNILDVAGGLKVDVIVPGGSAYDMTRMARAQRTRFGADLEGRVAAPEDVMLKKMEFYKEGGSEKHLRDIAGIIKISGDKLDWEYVARWAEKLGVSDIWREVMIRAKGGE